MSIIYINPFNKSPFCSPAKPKNKRKELEAKIKTMEGAYHLMDSIENLIKDDDEPPKSNNCQKSDTSKSNSNSEPEIKDSETVLKILTKNAENEPANDSERSRWSEKIQHLQAMKQNQLLLGIFKPLH